MVVLNPRFATLAALTSIAAMSMLPVPAEGAAIQARYHDETVSTTHHSSHSHSLTESSTSPTSTDEAKPARESKPVLPLPPVLAATGDDRSNEDTTGSTSHKGKSSSDVRKGGSDSDGHKGNSDSDSHGEGTGEDEHKAADKSRAKHEKDKRAHSDSLDPILEVGNIWVGAVQHRPGRGMKVAGAPPMVDKRHHDHDRPNAAVKRDSDHSDFHRSLRLLGRSPHDRVVVSGNDDHVHIHNEHHGDHDKLIVTGNGDRVHAHRSPPESRHDHDRHHDHDWHHDHDQDRVVVSGNDDHVHVDRAPHDHHWDHHHDDGHDDVVVSGDDDHVRIHRSPSARHHDDHHDHYDHYDHDQVDVSGDHDRVDVHRRTVMSRSVYIAGDHGDSYIVAHVLRHPPEDHYDGDGISLGYDRPSNGIDGIDVSVQIRRDEIQSAGVPGSIDIMTPVANSTTGQRIASLVLSQSSNNSTDDSDNSTTVADFVLNASGANHTQLYLVTIPSGTNSTNCTDPNSANSTDSPSFIRVALKIPMFDEETAMMKSYCATFDPNPPAPSPLTVEMCLDDAAGGEHKSQVFAYVPASGTIRPMWFQGEGNGTDEDEDPTESTPTDSSGDDSSVSDGSSNSTTATPQDLPIPLSNKVASSTSLDEEFGDATRKPEPALVHAPLAMAKAFSTDPSYSRNVTLVFTPAAPEVAPPVQKIADTATSSSSSASASTTDSASTTSVSASATTNASDSVSATTTSDTDSSSSGAMVTATSDVSASASTTAGAANVVAFSVANLAVSTGSASSDLASSTLWSTASSMASTTAASALDIEVFNPRASAAVPSASSPVVSVSSRSASSPSLAELDVVAPSTSADMDIASTTVTESGAATTTPASTAPYEWKFREGTARVARD